MLGQGAHHNPLAFIIKEEINTYQVFSLVACFQVIIKCLGHLSAAEHNITIELVLIGVGSYTAIAIGCHRKTTLVFQRGSVQQLLIGSFSITIFPIIRGQIFQSIINQL